MVDRLAHRGIIALFEDHDLVVIGANAASRTCARCGNRWAIATVAIVKRVPPLTSNAQLA